VPVRPKSRRRTALQRPATPRTILDAYLEIVRQNIERMRSFIDTVPAGVSARIVGKDARQLDNFSEAPTNGIQLIITSPPYGGAQKYVRSMSLSLGWLGLAPASSLRALEDQTIGREHFPKQVSTGQLPKTIPEADRVIARIAETNVTRACIAATYLSEMSAACIAMARSLNAGGYLVLVIGNNTIQGMPFRVSKFLTQILNAAGLVTRLRLIDDIKSRGLMTKRNKTASVITREWVVILEKPKGN
jgi:hypothetical protein